MIRFILIPFILLLIHDYLVAIDMHEKNVSKYDTVIKLFADTVVILFGSTFFSFLFMRVGLGNNYFCFFLVYLLIAFVDYLFLKKCSFLTIVLHQIILFFCVIFLFFLATVYWA